MSSGRAESPQVARADLTAVATGVGDAEGAVVGVVDGDARSAPEEAGDGADEAEELQAERSRTNIRRLIGIRLRVQL